MPDFIPRKDGDLAAWAANFALHVVPDAQRFNLRADAVALLVQRGAEFADALRLADAPVSRTSVSVGAKRAARAALEQIARPIAAQIRAVARDDRSTLALMGLAMGPGRSAPRRRIGAPGAAPVVFVRDVDGSRVRIVLRHDQTPARRAMHPDVASAHLYAFVGAQYPAALREWKHVGSTSRAATTIDLGPSHPPGTRVWITARWSNRRGEIGAHGKPVLAFLGYSGAMTTSRRAA